MEYDRHDTRHPRTSAIADSLAYAAALAKLYADNFLQAISRQRSAVKHRKGIK